MNRLLHYLQNFIVSFYLVSKSGIPKTYYRSWKDGSIRTCTFSVKVFLSAIKCKSSSRIASYSRFYRSYFSIKRQLELLSKMKSVTALYKVILTVLHLVQLDIQVNRKGYRSFPKKDNMLSNRNHLL